MKTQLLENRVRVTFRRPNGAVCVERLFDLADDRQRRQMGQECGEWQSMTVGNSVESVVVSIRRAQEVGK